MRPISNYIREFAFSTTKNVTYTVDHLRKTSYITLTNSSKRNTLSYQTLTGISQSLNNVEQEIQNQKIKTLFIKSEGPVFSSGHDLKQLTDVKKAEQIFTLCAQIFMRFNKLSIPVISVVNGLAAAAGLQLIASTDLVIATQKSTFSTPGVKWGLFCSTPGVALIRSITSRKKALQMLLLGQSITAQQAYIFGLINKVVKEEELQNEVNKYIQSFNKLSGQVIAVGKKAYNIQKNESSVEDAYKCGISAMIENIKLEDGKEGLKAFSEKRHPHFHK